MSTDRDALARWYKSEGLNEGNARLGFEAEFDGDRRPKVVGDTDPCDPSRYWDIFSCTD
jgi:hypothetical protein